MSTGTGYAVSGRQFDEADIALMRELVAPPSSIGSIRERITWTTRRGTRPPSRRTGTSRTARSSPRARQRTARSG